MLVSLAEPQTTHLVTITCALYLAWQIDGKVVYGLCRVCIDRDCSLCSSRVESTNVFMSELKTVVPLPCAACCEPELFL